MARNQSTTMWISCESRQMVLRPGHSQSGAQCGLQAELVPSPKPSLAVSQRRKETQE